MTYKIDNNIIQNLAKEAAIKRAYEFDKPKLRDPQIIKTYGSLTDQAALNYQSLYNLSELKKINLKEQKDKQIILTDNYKQTFYNNIKKL